METDSAIRRAPKAVTGGLLAALLLVACEAGWATEATGCAAVFQPGTTVTLAGKTTAGARNPFAVGFTLELSAGPAVATGIPIVAGTARSEKLPDGTVAWRGDRRTRWGNLCMDTTAPDGRHWSFLALTWEDDNAHPNLHAVIDWSADNRQMVGFVDTKDGTYHEAQVILDLPATAGATSGSGPLGGAHGAARGAALCEALFKGDKGHFFVGMGYATEPGANPGHLALRLEPGPGPDGAAALDGRLIATEAPHGLDPVELDPGHSGCLNLPDPRYAMLPLSTDRGVSFVLWLWGDDGIPQKNDRLMGTATYPGSGILRAKVALWRL